ncbi:hypothetical protein [uncultured Corynebacterium sp.]|uniref:IS1096 element passenger TnpR family protein n=1 Tax=uncultured Corynebacterium sp. TaxID=159447 RepID=UPI0025CD2C7A|nr:hypothetical protein [uncultured Corynebacterium sp.]
MTAPNVIDLATVRLSKDTTVILQIANVRDEAEVHRQVGVNAALTLGELHKILATCFGLTEDAPWHFYEHHGARGQRINPQHAIKDFLSRAGQGIDFTWGLWDFTITVAEVYPRDADTPRALCVGGSGSFGEPFDITAINARLTGRTTIAAVLRQVKPAVRDLVLRSKLYDYVPLLQAVDLDREAVLSPDVAAALRTLPREVTEEGRDAFWSTVLALTCMGDEELTDEVLETSLKALGWVDGDGVPLSADAARAHCTASLTVLERLGAAGPRLKAPVDRLDIYRALLRR